MDIQPLGANYPDTTICTSAEYFYLEGEEKSFGDLLETMFLQWTGNFLVYAVKMI